MLRLGVDIGGTKTEVVVLDNAGIERYRRREMTPHGVYEDALVWLEALIREAERAAGDECTIGIGTPGSLSRAHGRLRNAYATPYNEQPLQHDIEALLGRAVRIANDANCFALSEAVDGVARGAEVVFGAILGTGVGGGIVVRGRVLEGANTMAGEWGHNPLPIQLQSPPLCKCGRRGCIEAYLSGPGLAFDHATVSGENLAPEVIVARAAAGDSDCAATLGRYEERLARAFAGVINMLDPDMIVLGGGLSQLDRLYENVPRLWALHVYLKPEATRLVRPMHGDSSGVRGAAWLW